MRHPLRSAVAAAWSVALITVSLVGASLPAGAAPAAGTPLTKVEKKVLDELATKSETTFWVLLKDDIDLSAAAKTSDWKARGQLVYEQLTARAESSQAGLRALLRAHSVSFEPFWIVNTLRVKAGSAVLSEIAARPEVTGVIADGAYQIPDPLPGSDEARIAAIEWNVARINADKVWSSFNDRGEDIVIANIDTGVKFNHPALVNQYRGRKADGTFDHNYNWVDPSKVCGNPSVAPCDNNGHGTHTMGTMVGDDGNPGVNQIGVAPRAKWIAAKGCESSSCSFDALMKSGEWVLAPTDLTGANPRPDLRPHSVNNSWSGGGSDPFYRATVQKWVAAGIFPAFANGNPGSACGAVGAPGSYPESYGVGAFDISNSIAGFSGRGPSPAVFGGGIKPNVSAPGVNVRSAWNNDGYVSISGTSMATPHVAATVALVWSALPALKGDIAQTRALLDDTAISTADLTCGGTPDNNNVWGRGRLDAFAAVDMARSDVGTLQGAVTAATGGAPINGATVKIAGPSPRSRTTGPDGKYSARLKVGSYTLTVSAFGYLTQTATVDVIKDQTTTKNFALATAPSVQGHVTDANDQKPVGATVRALQGATEVARTSTDPAGFYKMFLDFGDFTIEAASRNYVTETADVSLVDATPVTQDFALTTGIAQVSPGNLEVIMPAGQQRTRTLTLSNTGSADLKFEIKESGGGKVSTGSSVGLTLNPNYDPNSRTTEGQFSQGNPPGWSITAPGRIIKQWPTTGLTLGWGIGLADKLWVSDVIPPRVENVEFTVDGAQTGRHWPTAWAGFWAGDMAYVPGRGLQCQVAVGADNGIYCWDPNTGAVVDSIRGSFDWSQTSQRGLAYRPDDDSFYIGGWNEGILYHIKGLSHPDKGTVIGKCTPPDRAISGLAWNPAARIVWEATNSPTDTIYQLNPSTCAVMGTLAHPVTGGFRGAGLEMDTTGDLWIVSQGQRAAPSTVFLVESGVPSYNKIPWLKETPTTGTVPPGGEQAIRLTFNSTGLEPGLYSGSLFFETNAGRQSVVRVPINLIVPAYRQGANVAAGLVYTDTLGDAWAADQAWDVDSWGYIDEGTVLTTTAPISGTNDPALYQKARVAPIAYRFDALPPGTYQVELRFAEIDPTVGLNERLFDVIIGNDLVLPAHDIVFAAGDYAADDYSFFVRVTEGQLNVRFVARSGYSDPIINAVRVTHRPDR